MVKSSETERKERMDTSSLMKQILSSDNLNRAYLQVVRNKGAEGVDGMKYTELKEHLVKNGEIIKEQLRTRKYKPQPVRRVEIPKPDGGVRNLGVPTVTDRFIQQAIAQVLTPIYEEQFHDHSYGFRPNRCAQQAILTALDISRFIEEKLGLKVNMTKSKVDRPSGLKYLGFGFYFDSRAHQFKAKPHAKSIAKFKKRMKGLTCRSWGVSNSYKVEKLNQLIRGWINYFKIGSMKILCAKLDANIRYRLRMCIWKHWKTPQNRAKNLMKLGIDRITAYKVGYCSRAYAHVCSCGAVNIAITNKRLASFGLISMLDYYTERCVTC